MNSSWPTSSNYWQWRHLAWISKWLLDRLKLIKQKVVARGKLKYALFERLRKLYFYFTAKRIRWLYLFIWLVISRLKHLVDLYQRSLTFINWLYCTAINLINHLHRSFEVFLWLLTDFTYLFASCDLMIYNIKRSILTKRRLIYDFPQI